MADITLPRANQGLINLKDGPQGNAGTATREFYNYLRQLATLTGNAELQGEIDAIILRIEALEAGEDFTIQGQFSVAVTGQPSTGLVMLALRNDLANPGNKFYYGTNSFGVKGWYLRDLATLFDVDFTIPPVAGDSLVYNGTSWRASEVSTASMLPIVTGEIVSGQPVFVIGPDGSLIYGPVVDG